MLTVVTFAFAIQQAVASSTPPSGDPKEYWQQRADYEIHARLDDERGVLHGRAVLNYVNNSPDTLRELYVHQHLNAFRPGSAWSSVDEREGRVRFQKLSEPDYAYERFTSTPTINGTSVEPEYTGAPDSTVVRFELPRPLPPADSIVVRFEWEARPSTVPRRQGRRGRHVDFAHWYPRVAVYDRLGWQPNPLVPAGEFYGEFGTFDVTLDLAADQVVGATGVLVEGDPGWSGALRWGEVAGQPDAYDDLPARRLNVSAPMAGRKHVRFLARDVHHFGWSAAPGYRYEGGWYVRESTPRGSRFPVWDSVAVHVLYQPGDESTWGGGVVVNRTRVALDWLERTFGPYAWPQLTAVHRIEGGGTEFPMLMMNGSPSQGLVLHEGGHMYVHGMLANNEWRSGWMDEGLSSYQTRWAQGLTPHERIGEDDAAARGAGGRAVVAQPGSRTEIRRNQALYDITGMAQPPGTTASGFRDYATYSRMVYGRAELMFGALRDAMGDDRFRDFLQRYYERWAFRHVDEMAMRAEASAAAGEDMSWFFDQWVHRTGLVDYSLGDVSIRRVGSSWETEAQVVRHGEYRHPMPVGVRTSDGWKVLRAAAQPDEQSVRIFTSEAPLEVRLDPFDVTPDWFPTNNLHAGPARLDTHSADPGYDPPALRQERGGRRVSLLSPLVWYSRPGGMTGVLRARSNFPGILGRLELAAGVSSRVPRNGRNRPEGSPPGTDGSPQTSRWQGWLLHENPIVPGSTRPFEGFSYGVWRVDGLWRVDARREWYLLRPVAGGRRARMSLAVTGTYPYDHNFYDPERWSGRSATDLTVGLELRPAEEQGIRMSASLTGGYAVGAGREDEPYARAEASATYVSRSPTGHMVHMLRMYVGGEIDAPRERATYLSALSPTQSFPNHLLRPEGAPLALPEVRYVSVGGAALRGYDPRVRVPNIVAVNAEEALRVHAFGEDRRLELFASLFADIGMQIFPDTLADGSDDALLADAGIGIALRGPLLERDVRLRVDFPIWVSRPALSYAWTRGRENEAAMRVTFSFTDLW